MKQVLDLLPPKVISVASGKEPKPVALEVDNVERHVQNVKESIQRATFTGKGDKDTVPQLYASYVGRIVEVLQPLLAVIINPGSAALQLPPMPIVSIPDAVDELLSHSSYEKMREWHKQVQCAEHVQIADPLSGRHLGTLEDCVPIKVTGRDAAGRQLEVTDAASVSAWLHRLRLGTTVSRSVLLTAGPAAGKTWLMSQVRKCGQFPKR